jgi:hypothetical protein
MSIDWSKAPEGATHWDTGMYGRVAGWMKLDDDVWYWWPSKDASCDMKWHASLNQHMIQTEGFVERPATWSGEGLLPVGTVCELRAHKMNEWGRAVIKFASRNVVVWDWEGEPSTSGLCTRYAHEIEFRPIRTPEQIAAEEREKAIVELIADTDGALGPYEAGKVYDACYRKQVTP